MSAPSRTTRDESAADVVGVVEVTGMAGGPTRRSRAEGGRPHMVRVSLSDFEMAALLAAAARSGQAVATFLGEAGVSVATAGRGPASSWSGMMRELMTLREELKDARRLLRNVGGNLNDVAAHANSTGEIRAGTDRVLGVVDRAVGRVDQAVADVDAAVATARGEQQRLTRAEPGSATRKPPRRRSPGRSSGAAGGEPR